MINAIAAEGIPTYGGRTEGSMCAAADGFTRVTGEVAACSGTEGPGFTNMIMNIGAANAARTPLLVLASNMTVGGDDTERGIQRGYQQPTTVGMKKYGKRLITPNRVYGYAAYAFRQLKSGVPRPVHLDFTGEVAFDPDAKVIRIDPDAADIGRNLPVDLGLVASARGGLEALAEALPSASRPACPARSSPAAWPTTTEPASNATRPRRVRRGGSQRPLVSVQSPDEAARHCPRLLAEVRRPGDLSGIRGQGNARRQPGMPFSLARTDPAPAAVRATA